ncbi:MAG: hypothetical protein K9H26_01165 [Prolixibacteraceae bacterium]|nr:hypothetical protein [Prolixibacteraceae bacterium]
MNRKFFFALLMLISNCGFAQISDYDLIVIPKEHLMIVSDHNTYATSIDGSPFLDTTYTMGTMVIQGISYDIPMRYNVLDNVFQIKYKGKPMYIKSDVIDTVHYNNTTFVVKKFDGERRVLEIIKPLGDNLLLKNQVVEFIPAQVGVPFKDNVYAHFEKEEPGYYFYIPGKGLMYIFNFNSLTKYYPESKKQIKSFVRKNKLKKDNEEDLAILLKFVSDLD